MESDLNYPKSKAFNIFLRFLQLALSLASTIFVAEFVEKACVDAEFRVVEIVIGVLLLGSIAALLAIKCTASHPKMAFAVLFVVTLAAVVAIGFFSIKDMVDGSECALTSILYKYYLATSALYALVAIAILVLPLLWIQRFSNSPGNLVWPIFFFLFAFIWTNTHRWPFLILALITLAISILTLSAHLFAGCKGVTTGTKSLMLCSTITNLILMVGAEGLAIWLYATCRSHNEFSDYRGNQAKGLLQIFILVNLIDLIFWLYGLQTLDYENGDSVRDGLVAFGRNSHFQDDSEVHEDYMPAKDAPFGQLS